MATQILHLHLASFTLNEPAILLAISKDGERWFEVPAGMRTAQDNQALFSINKVKTNAVQCAQSSAKSSYRRFAVSISGATYSVYVDEQGDFCMHDVYLEELNYDFRPKRTAAGAAESSIEERTSKLLELMLKEKQQKLEMDEEMSQRGDPNQKLLEFLVKEKQEKESCAKKANLRELQLKMIIKKFDRRMNGEQWISDYEKECERANVVEGSMKIDCLKACLEEECLDWYDACVLKLERDDWSCWKNSFVDTFGTRGWADIRHAYGFKFIAGSLVTYANAKEKKLLEVDKEMPEKYRMNMIVYGLPKDVQEKLDRKKVGTITELIANLSMMDDGYTKKPTTSKERAESDLPRAKKFGRSGASEECPACAKVGMPNRVHAIDRCWTLEKLKKQPKRERSTKMKHEINLSELDIESLRKLLEPDSGSSSESEPELNKNSKN